MDINEAQKQQAIFGAQTNNRANSNYQNSPISNVLPANRGMRYDDRRRALEWALVAVGTHVDYNLHLSAARAFEAYLRGEAKD